MKSVLCVLQVSELRGEVSRLEAEKEELEKELDTQTNHTQKQVGRKYVCEPVAHSVQITTQSGNDTRRLIHMSMCLFR